MSVEDKKAKTAAEGVELCSSSWHVDIAGWAARVSHCQLFTHRGNRPVEALYRYRFDPKLAAVTGFEARVSGGPLLRGQLEERAAPILPSSDAEPATLRLPIGNLEPGQEAQTKVDYVMELQVASESSSSSVYRLVVPINEAMMAVPHDQGEVVTVSAAMHERIRGITSPSHTLSNLSINGKQAAVSVAGKDMAATDLILEFETERDDATAQASAHVTAIVGKLPRDKLSSVKPEHEYAAVITLTPILEVDCDPKSEIIFLIDRSKAMEGPAMEGSVQALRLFLQSLPTSVTFNIVSFGTRHSSLFPQPAPMNNDNLRAAHKLLDTMAADMEGTGLAAPLREIFATEPQPGYTRSIFVLTQAPVSETEDTEASLKLVKEACSKSQRTRVFSFGIGPPLTTLVSGIAAHGVAEFLSPEDRMQATVLSSLKKALRPQLLKPSLAWGTTHDFLSSVLPEVMRFGERYTAVAFLPPEALVTGTAELVFTAGGTTWDYRQSFTINNDDVFHGDVIHLLAASEVLRFREAQGATKHRQEMIDVSKEFGVLCSQTAFAVVAARDEAEAPELVAADETEPPLNLAQLEAEERELAEVNPFAWAEAGTAATSAPRQVVELVEMLACEEIRTAVLDPGAQSFRTGFAGDDAPPTIFPPLIARRRPFRSVFVTYEQGMYLGHEAACRGCMLFDLSNPFDCDPSPKPSAVPAWSARPRTPDLRGPAVDTSVKLSAAEQNKMDAILFCQNADGSWELMEELARALGKSVAQLQGAVPAEAQKLGAEAVVEGRVWATALALASLSAWFPVVEHEWELIAARARRFLLKLPCDLASLLARATQFLSATSN